MSAYPRASGPGRPDPQSAGPESIAPRKRRTPRPERWVRAIERRTEDFRDARASELEHAGRQRGLEAIAVLEAMYRLRRDLMDNRAETIQAHDHDTARQVYDAWLGTACAGGDHPLAEVLGRWEAELRPRRLRGSTDESPVPDSLIPLTLGSAARSEGIERWIGTVIAEAARRAESTWHADRAIAERERFERVFSCGKAKRGVIRCKKCKHVPLEVMELCGNHWACPHCRELRKHVYRARFESSRQALLERIRAERLGRGQCVTPLLERFLTLTVPDDGSPVEHRANVLLVAWRKFWQRLKQALHRRWLDGRPAEWAAKAAELIHCVRVLEITPGTHDQGHAHMHVWWTGPFIRAEYLRAMWGHALRGSGLDLDGVSDAAWKCKAELLAEIDGGRFRAEIEWTRQALKTYPQRMLYPRIDVAIVQERKGRRGGDASLASELVKYITKDIGGDGRMADVDVYAAIYRSLSGRRVLTATHGFWVRRPTKPCDCCGETAWSMEPEPRSKRRPRRPKQLRLVR